MDLSELGEEYYYLKFDKTTFTVEKKKWENSVFDVVMFQLNNVYSNENEAEENKGRVIENVKELMSEVRG